MFSFENLKYFVRIKYEVISRLLYTAAVYTCMYDTAHGRQYMDSPAVGVDPDCKTSVFVDVDRVGDALQRSQ